MVDEDLNHIDGDIALFLVKGLDDSVLISLFLGGENVLDEFEEGGNDVGEVGNELLAEFKRDSLPTREDVTFLWVNLLELAGLEGDEDVDDGGQVRQEELLADSVGDQGDALNGLTSELLVLGVNVLVEEVKEDWHGLIEVRVEVLLGSLSGGSDRGDGVLLNDGDSLLEHGEGFNEDIIEEWFNKIFINLFNEVGDGSETVRGNSRYGVIKQDNQLWGDCGDEMFLETWFHIIGYLSNRVTDGVSDLGVGVADELHDSSNDWLDLLDLIDVLSDLGESHDGGENVSPVRVSQHFIDCSGHNRDDLGLSDG